MQPDNLNKSAKSALTNLLNDPSPSVQIAAAETLCYNVFSGKAIETLGRWLFDDRPWVVLQAALSILLIEEVVRPLIPMMYKKLEMLYDDPASSRKFKDFNYASFTGWALEWALKELGENIQVN